MKLIHCLAPLTLAALICASGPAAGAPPETNQSAANPLPSERELGLIKQEVETLRGNKFKRDVPAHTISETEMRAMIDRELAKDYPGPKLANYEELLAWLDFAPPHTDLSDVYTKLTMDQVAGLYDDDTKMMYIPSGAHTNAPAAKTGKNSKRANESDADDFDLGVTFSHEYTHALEDQYWPFDDPKDKESTDRGDAHGFLLEGSATRLMVEALPSEVERRQPGTYFLIWNVIHSDFGESVLDTVMKHFWKFADVKEPGVPEALARSEIVPYSFGYTFCRQITRDWGLDGLDYIYDHPPVSTAQVMHPEKCWEWRDLPVKIGLPETLAGGWKQRIDDSVGEAGIAVLLGTELHALNRGLRVAAGWKGDHVALYEAEGGRKLMVWASAWDSAFAARRFRDAVLAERRKAHKAVISGKHGQMVSWTSPDGRSGKLLCAGNQVILFETDQPAGLDEISGLAKDITFTAPPEEAARASANNNLIRFNPLVSSRTDGDFTVTQCLGGILWRHDQNSVGVGDRAVWGALGEWHRTASLDKWQLGWGWLVKHEAEARRKFSKTTLLPWGVLFSHFAAAVPDHPDNTMRRSSILWSLGASCTVDSEGHTTHTILPFGILFRSSSTPKTNSCHILGTGYARREKSGDGTTTTRYRVLGIRVWTAHQAKTADSGR